MPQPITWTMKCSLVSILSSPFVDTMCHFTKRSLVFLIACILFVCNCRTSFADIVTSYNYVRASAFAENIEFRSDGSWVAFNHSNLKAEPDQIYGNGTLTASTDDPTYIFSYVEVPVSPGSAVATTSASASQISIETSAFRASGFTSLYHHNDIVSQASGSSGFSVTEDAAFTLTNASSGGSNEVLYFSAMDLGGNFMWLINQQGISSAGTTLYSGTLYAGWQYELNKITTAGIFDRDYYNFQGEHIVSNFFNGDSGTGLVVLSLASVPEPSSFALAGLGGIGLIVAAIRRRRTTAA